MSKKATNDTDSPGGGLDDTLSYGAADVPEEAPTMDFALKRGAIVDRYIVLGKVGEGGMGAVYAAYDPELDRKVALKFLHGWLTGKEDRAVEQARLLREAQAMAKLSHPNVAAVYDVGNYAGLVFIAIEFIEGQTLRDWLDDRPRTGSDIWPILKGAGRGLAAAHAAGIVHRDFKPDNILVDSEGRARVTDFGLARPTSELSVSDDELANSSGPLHEQLTRTGAIMGTPRYMAPEQHLGRETSEHTDQFAFCIVMFEALYGERAFRGESLPELADAVTNGELVQPKMRGLVPAWRHRALERGLTVRAAGRFESMSALLVALEQNPSARRNRLLAATGVTVLAATAALLLWPTPKNAKAPALCTNSEQAMTQTWNQDQRKRIHDAFVVSKSPIAEDSAKQVGKLLDRYTKSWVAMHKDSCEATNVLGEQSPELLDLRTQCLNERRVGLAGLLAVFSEQPNQKTVTMAARATLALPSVAACADTRALSALVPPPNTPEARDKVARLSDRFARVEAFAISYNLGKASSLIPALLKEARAVGYARLTARVLTTLAKIQQNTGKSVAAIATFREAAQLAAESRDNRLATRIWINLAQSTGVFQRKPKLAAIYIDTAEASARRAGSPPALLAQLNHVRTFIALSQADYPSARAAAERGLALWEQVTPPDLRAIGRTHSILGSVLVSLGKWELAAKHNQKGIAMLKDASGPNHPDVAMALTRLGRLQKRAGKYAQAQLSYEKAIAIQRKVFGNDNSPTISTRAGWANTLSAAGKTQQAAQEIAKIVAVLPRSKSNPATTANVLDVATKISLRAKQWTMGRKLIKQRLQLISQRFGKREQVIATALARTDLAYLCQKVKDWDCAWKQASLVQRDFAKTYPATHERHAEPLGTLGQIHMGRDEPAKAIPLFERALALILKNKPKPTRVGEFRMVLAEALVKASVSNRGRAIKLAQQARENFLSSEEADKAKRVAEVDAFVKKHRAKP